MIQMSLEERLVFEVKGVEDLVLKKEKKLLR